MHSPRSRLLSCIAAAWPDGAVRLWNVLTDLTSEEGASHRTRITQLRRRGAVIIVARSLRSAKTVYCQVHIRLVRRMKIVQHNMPYITPYSRILRRIYVQPCIRILGRIPVYYAVQWRVNDKKVAIYCHIRTQHNTTVRFWWKVFASGSGVS